MQDTSRDLYAAWRNKQRRHLYSLKKYHNRQDLDTVALKSVAIRSREIDVNTKDSKTRDHFK